MSKQDREDNERGACANKLTKRLSVLNLSGILDKSANNIMNVSRINALRNSINSHNDTVAKILLPSKETAEKKLQIESAFRVCKEAFFDLSAACLFMFENNASMSSPSTGEVKDAITGALSKFCSDFLSASNVRGGGGDRGRRIS